MFSRIEIWTIYPIREWLWLLFEIFYIDIEVLTKLDKFEGIKHPQFVIYSYLVFLH